jgi:hydroxymethylbilane synthase
LTIGAVCARDDVRDVLISNDGSGLDQLPAGSLIGTSSLRRQAQLRARRPDLEPAEIRGNVDTRLRKLREGLFDAIVLAKAGLDRLGWSDQISEVFSTETMLPAVGQGALGVEARADDAGVLSLLELVDHAPTRVAVMAERALLHELHGGCQIPVGAWGRTENDELVLDGGVISLDGRAVVRDRINGPPEQSVALGAQLAAKLLAQGADRILQGVNVYRATQHVSHDAFDS